MISSFTGEHRWLSNFWYAEVAMSGQFYPTVEHAFQAAKTTNLEERLQIRNAPSPGAAKKMGRHVTLRPNWVQMKVTAMKTLVNDKFTRHPSLAAKLIATGDEELVEGNAWGDRFWGQSPVGTGRNQLGIILMQVRKSLR